MRGRMAAAKRGGGEKDIAWDTHIEVGDENATRADQAPDLHRALEALERDEPALAQVVEMHYFGGMTADEAALALGRSVHCGPSRTPYRPCVAAARARRGSRISVGPVGQLDDNRPTVSFRLRQSKFAVTPDTPAGAAQEC